MEDLGAIGRFLEGIKPWLASGNLWEGIGLLLAAAAGIRSYYRMKSEHRAAQEDLARSRIELARERSEWAGERAGLAAEVATRTAEGDYLRKKLSLFEEVGTERARSNLSQPALLASVQEGARKMIAFHDRIEEAKRRGIWYLPANRNLTPRGPGPRFIAVANLKGGVGKSTISANLGAELASRGKRVLMVDLDWQQSLTRLSLTRGQTTAHLAGESGAVSSGLLRYAGIPTEGLHDFRPIRVERNSSDLYLLPASYRLVLAEDLALLSWFSQEPAADARFAVAELLRDWTHPFRPDPNHDVEVDLDYVILDCPPRLTVSLTGALSCSDLVLIPTLPDDVSMNGVALLFSKPLRGLRQVLWPSQQEELFGSSPVFGIVSNRVRDQGQLPKIVEDVRQFAEGLNVEHKDFTIEAATTGLTTRTSYRDAVESVRQDRREFAVDRDEVAREQMKSLANDVERWLRDLAPAQIDLSVLNGGLDRSRSNWMLVPDENTRVNRSVAAN